MIVKTFNTFSTVASLSFMSGGVGGGVKCNVALDNMPEPVNDLLINLILLLIALFCIFLFWNAVAWVKKFRTNSTPDILGTKQKIIISFIALLYLVYSNFVRLWFQLFSCTQYRGESKRRLNGALDIFCYESVHLSWLAVLGLPVGICVIFGIPAGAYWILSHSKRGGASAEGTYTKSTYGFLMDGYARNFWYWELMILFKKIALNMVAIFMANSGTLDPKSSQYRQGLVALFILFVAFSLHVYFQPYEDEIDAGMFNLNMMETISCAVGIMCVYLGLWLVCLNII